MATLRFYAARDDLLRLMEFVYEQTDCRVYEAYSGLDQALRQFGSVHALDAACRLGLDPPGEGVALLALHSPAAGGGVRIRRIELRPEAVPGHTHRFVAEGWGLVWLELGRVQGSTVLPSTLSHNGERRARSLEQTYADRLGPVDAWDWDALEQLSGRLRHHVRRLAVRRDGGRPVLPAASRLLGQSA